MARPLRLPLPGGIYHVTARGNDRQAIFEGEADCSLFLIVLASVVTRYRVRCHAYCLMGNHYHLLLETPEGNLSAAMRQLNGVYTQRFNRRYERCGHVCRYIVLNPVRAALSSHPRDRRWSSFRATAGEGPVPGFLTVDWVRSLSGVTGRAGAISAYGRFVEAALGQSDDALDRFHSKPELADPELARRLDEHCRAVAQCPEIPRAQRFASRPPLAQLFDGVATRADRNARAVTAVRDHGYAMKEVADFLGRHYVTVSRALAHADGLPSR
jgi:REP element-mobilizing transposase RayT